MVKAHGAQIVRAEAKRNVLRVTEIQRALRVTGAPEEAARASRRRRVVAVVQLVPEDLRGRSALAQPRRSRQFQRGVTFATRGHQTVTVPAVEFLRRFVDQVLPRGSTKIRHYALLAPCHATTTLETARALLAPRSSKAPAPAPGGVPDAPIPQTWVERLLSLTGVDALRCRRCLEGRITVRPLADFVEIRTVVDAARVPLYDLWIYMVDSGSIFESGTTREIGAIAQGGVVLREPNATLRVALQAMTAKKPPKPPATKKKP